MTKTKLTSEDINTVRQQVLTLGLTQGLSNAEMSRRSGVAQSTLSQFLSDKYPGDNEKIATDLKKWLESFSEQQLIHARLKSGGKFVITQTTEAITSVFRYSHGTGDMAAIYGAPGLGKSDVAAEFARRAPLTWHFECAPSISSPTALLRAIARAMNLSNCSNAEAIRVHIEQHLMAPSLLIIDEAQHLGPNALEEARALFDAVSPLGIVLMGNEHVVSRMAGGGRDAMFAQLSSRAGMKYKVEPWPKEEVVAVVASYGIKAEKEIDFLFDVSRTHGALRKVDRVIKLARMIQPADEQDNLLPFLKTAAKQLSVTGAVA